MNLPKQSAKLDPAKQKAAGVLVEKLRPHLAGSDPDIAGMALGELVAIFIASHAPPLRSYLFKLQMEVARDLVPVIVDEMIEQGRAPPDWRGNEAQWKTKRRNKRR